MSGSTPNLREAAVDTNAVIDFLMGVDAVHQRITAMDRLFLPVIVLGELCHGAFTSNRPTDEFKKIEEVEAITALLTCDRATSAVYGQLKYQLRRKGRPIPENDLWIAALCLQHGLTLITRDAHFDHIEELSVVSW